MNNKYIEDFNNALNIYETDYSHDDLITFLQSGTVAQKQAAALKLDIVKNSFDVEIFMQNLTGCDGKIREAISFRLPEFVSKNPELFEKYSEIFLDAIIDINGNICRNTICALEFLKNHKIFCDNFCPKLIERTLELAKIVKTFNLQDGKYKINKEIFKLYWYLETLCVFSKQIKNEIFTEIIMETKNIIDYTIREKTAKLLSKLNKTEQMESFYNELKNDQNYYVRRL